MSKQLVVVESPAKARTLKKFLGKDFEVLASYGHIRDLRPKVGAVEPDNDFAMHYELIEKGERHVTALSRAMKKADTLLLATDPDREGEAIAWHLVEVLKEKNGLDDKVVRRVVFHEITQRAIQEAVDHPRELSMELVNAQQARRALDYLVGFNLSPLLWKKIRKGLSAGRVQSPALRLICEREAEIEAFKKREYWSIEADASASDADFVARLVRFAGEKVAQFTVTTAERAKEVETVLRDAAGGRLRVLSVEKKQRRRNPAAPFTTSTLQQEAARKLGFTAQRTMRIAQQLYEGIEIDGSAVGLISYMRTDSVTLAAEAVEELRGFIEREYGKKALPGTVRTYKTKAKNAQEAHEAIRPTSVLRTPDEVHGNLSGEQAKLYQLIWKRTVACQMVHATIDTVAIELGCGDSRDHAFRATGSTIVDPGFLAVYEEGVDDAVASEEGKRLPPMKEGEEVALKAIRPEQHFTEPPPRYSEATLIRTLEDYGIGRPSTYASIISTLLNREYVELEKRRFQPTDVGRMVNAFLTEHFSKYVDYDFTAHLEDDLDAISRGEKQWVPVLRDFWTAFDQQVKEKDQTVSRRDAAMARELGIDPKSGKVVTVRMGRYGPYASLGTVEDEEKPRFASLRSGQSITSISLEEALALFKLPRELGTTTDGEPVAASVGRFGPYVKYGSKFASMGKEDDPYTITIERALELVAAKKEADANREIRVFEDAGVKVLNGRYGPYITNGSKNARVPKDQDPAALSLDECLELLAKAPAARGKRGGKRRATT